MKRTRNNLLKKINDNLWIIWLALIAAIALTIIVMPFRLYSSLNALSSMTAARVQQDLDAPFNLPILRSGSSTQLIRDIPQTGFSFDIGYAITGRLWGWNDVVLDGAASAVLPYADTPVPIRFRFPQAFQTLGGNWRGEAARIVTTGAMTKTVTGTPGNPESRWGEVFGVSSTLEYVSPYLNISIPLDSVDLGENILDRRISVAVELDVEYPTYSGPSAYEDRSGTIAHSFELTVLTPEEATEYETVRKAYLVRQMPISALSWLGVLSVEVLLFLSTGRIGRILDGLN